MMSDGSRLPGLGALVGAAVALLLLLAVAVALARVDGSAVKALAAAWLVALPVLGVGSLGGWLLGLGARALVGARRRR